MINGDSDRNGIMKNIKKCKSCDEYTLYNICRSCGEKTINPRPPKYSPEDTYGEYRRKQKMKKANNSRC